MGAGAPTYTKEELEDAIIEQFDKEKIEYGMHIDDSYYSVLNCFYAALENIGINITE